MKTANEALQSLIEGNQRFAQGQSTQDPSTLGNQRKLAVEGQAPFAVILGCSDSRVPVEIIFDQTLGDLFVIRVAGNVVASSQIGSIEFAAAKFGTRLVIVMGHTQCGAVSATLEQIKQPAQSQSRGLSSIVNRIQPAIAELANSRLSEHPDELMEAAVRANIRAATSQLRRGSAILEQLIEEDGLRVIGAEYSLETGLVDFFDNETS